MEELNIIEASNMPYGTEFKVKIDCYYKHDDVYRIRDNTKLIAVNTQSGIKFKEYTDIEKASKTLINATFIPVQNPVSFMDVVNSGKRCRVEYPNAPDGYWFLDDMLYWLGSESGSELCAEIIKNGKWYIEA